jgi:hypothetical protein
MGNSQQNNPFPSQKSNLLSPLSTAKIAALPHLHVQQHSTETKQTSKPIPA